MTKRLFIHGAGGSKSKWRRVSPHFNDFSADYIDLPGHGSSRDTVPSSIEAYADAIGNLIVEDVIVVGHSMGGLIGIELAAQNTHVKGLILTASHYRLPVHPKFLQQLEHGEYPDKFFYAAYSKDADPELLAEEKKEHDEMAIKTAFADFLSCNHYNGKTAMTTLEIPVLAVYGAEDRMIPPDSKEKLLLANPSVETMTIDGAGHYLILEKPQAFENAVRKYQKNKFGGSSI